MYDLRIPKEFCLTPIEWVKGRAKRDEGLEIPYSPVYWSSSFERFAQAPHEYRTLSFFRQGSTATGLTWVIQHLLDIHLPLIF
jgi:hypothetical protein